MDVSIIRREVRLTATDSGNGPPSILFLHGLAGHAGEWASSANGLDRARTVAVDARGHGRSERRPPDVSLDAQVTDAAFVIGEMGLAPSIVVGQSIGGLVAMLLASRRPELVAGLVIVEADPNLGGTETAAEVEAWLRSWPVPFASRQDAERFFKGSTSSAAAWAGGLEERPGGLWPAFDVDVLLAMLDDAVTRDYWADWAAIDRPTLIVYGQDGDVGAETAQRMAGAIADATAVEVEGAGHDPHLDQPEVWQAILSSFVDELASR